MRFGFAIVVARVKEIRVLVRSICFGDCCGSSGLKGEEQRREISFKSRRLDFIFFSIVLAGVFVKNKGLEYVEGEIHVIKGIDPNRWSYFEAMGFVREFKYDAEFKLWWNESKQKAMNNLRILSDDSEAMLLANYAKAENDEVEIYVQPSQPVEVNFVTFGEEAPEK
ncbi:uncharacterized protein HKW66_Vig0185160 [Vigna angularis]|uniref:PB1-like domain-containing protein n=1 Tax=Phaseolus angularis TaxID=3914 RepID=A0A8T0KSL8_PHAAN|nr:uncharacterized protein HKW66_Vig0185160 [Vigna angularis]